MQSSNVGQEFGQLAASVASLEHLPHPEAPADLQLPTANRAEQLLRQFGVDETDILETLANRPDPDRHPALWWILSRVGQDIVANMGRPVSIHGFTGYPPLPATIGAPGRFLPIWTFLALVPFVRRFHRQHGISDDTSTTSLGTALVAALRGHRAATGLGGLGLWGFGWTLPLRFRGVDYQLGRLGFHLGDLSFSDGVCGHILGVHILAGSPLDPDACTRSLQEAQVFFATHFPDLPVSFFTCESWLMDPQLLHYLSPTANIVQFQRRFTIVPNAGGILASHQCDDEMRDYIFGSAANLPLTELPQQTSLQRAFVEHLQSGRHWYARTGWLPTGAFAPPPQTSPGGMT